MVGHMSPECYNLEGVPDAEKQERWEEILSSTHVDMHLRLDPSRPVRNFQASARRIWIDDLALVDATCDPCSGENSLKQIKGADIDYVVVLINRGGSEAVSQNDATTRMSAGDAVIWDSTRPVQFTVLEPLTKRSLFIPRTALHELGARGLDLAGATFDKSSPATELLTSYLDVLTRTVDELPPAAVASARNATLNLVATALHAEQAPELSGTSGTAALRRKIDQWIEQNLDRADLTPSTIALRHHISVRSVHRLFERSGDSVSTFIRTLRLARARHELTTTDSPITDIAARWQFYDPSHFTRAFRAQYGVSPSQYRSAPAWAS